MTTAEWAGVAVMTVLFIASMACLVAASRLLNDSQVLRDEAEEHLSAARALLDGWAMEDER